MGRRSTLRWGNYQANAFGLHDVAGNLWEWCLDGYHKHYYGSSPKVDPVAPTEGTFFRVDRGGSYGLPAIFARSANRSSSPPTANNPNQGVRPARRIEE